MEILHQLVEQGRAQTTRRKKPLLRQLQVDRDLIMSSVDKASRETRQGMIYSE